MNRFESDRDCKKHECENDCHECECNECDDNWNDEWECPKCHHKCHHESHDEWQKCPKCNNYFTMTFVTLIE